MFFNVIMNICDNKGVMFDAITVDLEGASRIANEVERNGGSIKNAVWEKGKKPISFIGRRH